MCAHSLYTKKQQEATTIAKTIFVLFFVVVVWVYMAMITKIYLHDVSMWMFGVYSRNDHTKNLSSVLQCSVTEIDTKYVLYCIKKSTQKKQKDEINFFLQFSSAKQRLHLHTIFWLILLYNNSIQAQANQQQMIQINSKKVKKKNKNIAAATSARATSKSS